MAAKRMVASGARPGEIVVVRLTYGELLLESIQEICKQRRIRDGVILTGFGSLTDFAVSGAIGASFPPRKFYQRTRPRGVEILAMAGVIANYHVHCHLVLSDRNRAFGGHLEKRCRVLRAFGSQEERPEGRASLHATTRGLAARGHRSIVKCESTV